MGQRNLNTMMRPYTISHKIRVADMENPFKPGRTILDVRYKDSNTNESMLLTSWHNTITSDQMVSKLFDLSLRGYFVHDISIWTYEPCWEYTIVLNLGFSKSMKTNIDDSVVERVSEILSDPS